MKERNAHIHTNGNIFYSSGAALDIKIREILRVVVEIQEHSKPVIEHCCRDFLVESHDPDGREYFSAADRTREVLIHDNYLSQEDIGFCLRFDLASLAGRQEIDSIHMLHEALAKVYRSD